MVVPRYYHGTSVATEVKSDYFRRRGSAAAAQPTVGWSENCRDQNIMISTFKVNKHGFQKGKNLLNTL